VFTSAESHPVPQAAAAHARRLNDQVMVQGLLDVVEGLHSPVYLFSLIFPFGSFSHWTTHTF
jgi:hypothetical protein